MRRTPFRRKAPMARSGWDVTTSDAARSDRPDPVLAKVRPHRGLKPIPAAARRAVKELAGGCCEACGRCLEHGHVHHRKLRSQGGTNDVTNLAYCCFDCHNRIHANPDAAYRLGLLVKPWDDPASIDIDMWPAI